MICAALMIWSPLISEWESAVRGNVERKTLLALDFVMMASVIAAKIGSAVVTQTPSRTMTVRRLIVRFYSPSSARILRKGSK